MKLTWCCNAEAGGNMIDAANYYQDGESEQWVGEWMKARGNREHMIIATKYTGPFGASTIGKNSHAVNHAGNSRRSLHVSVRHSLEKLQTDWIDLLYMHFWDYSASIPEVMDGLHSLIQQGKVMYLGVSNTPAWIVAAANDYAIQHGKTPFCTFQGRWNLIQRDIELEIVPMCLHYGMSISPWEVIGTFSASPIPCCCCLMACLLTKYNTTQAVASSKPSRTSARAASHSAPP